MNEKSWTKWSAVAEIISSIAILITLFFLLIQTQQNNEILRSQAQLNQLQNSNFINFLILEDPDIAEMTFKTLQGEELSEFEIYKIETALAITISFWQFEYMQMQAGYLDLPERDWQRTVNNPVFLRVWNDTKSILEPDFVDYIESEFFQGTI